MRQIVEQNQVYYRRNRNPKSPMSEWGHALFVADDEDLVSSYGPYLWRYVPGTEAIFIDDVISELRKTIMKYIDLGFHVISNDFELWLLMGLDVDDILDMFVVDDIIYDANAYDNEVGISLMWETLERIGKSAVLLEDGAVVFDERRVERVE